MLPPDPSQQPQGQAQPPQGQPQESDAGISKAITTANTSLLKIKEVIGGLPMVSDQVKAMFDGVIQNYQAAVQGLADSVSNSGGSEQTPAGQPAQAQAAAPQAPKKVPARGPVPLAGSQSGRPLI